MTLSGSSCYALEASSGTKSQQPYSSRLRCSFQQSTAQAACWVSSAKLRCCTSGGPSVQSRHREDTHRACQPPRPRWLRHRQSCSQRGRAPPPQGPAAGQTAPRPCARAKAQHQPNSCMSCKSGRTHCGCDAVLAEGALALCPAHQTLFTSWPCTDQLAGCTAGRHAPLMGVLCAG